MSNTDKITRRHVPGGPGVGLASLVVNPVIASPVDEAGSGAAGLEDLTIKNPRPPFKDQKQRWPGLAKQIAPQPDHGEKCYKGSGRLKGRKALITGGDSGMGRAAAIAYAREGADVAINYYPSEEPDARDVIALMGS